MRNLASKPRLSLSLPAALLISVVASLGACAPQGQSQRGMSTTPAAVQPAQPAFWGWTAEPAAQPSGPTFWGFSAERVAQPSGPTFWGYSAELTARPSGPTFWGYAPPAPMQPSRESQSPLAVKR